MVKDFPYVGFADIARESDQPTRDEPLVHRLRLRAAALIERDGGDGRQGWLAYALAGGLAWTLYRVADLLERWS